MPSNTIKFRYALDAKISRAKNGELKAILTMLVFEVIVPKIDLTGKVQIEISRILGVFYMLFLLMLPIDTMAGILGENIKPYVGAGSTFDSNLFRLSENENTVGTTQRSDIFVRTEFGLVADIPIERQKVFADLNVNYNQYQNNSFLDYTGGSAKIRWDWEIGDQWSGQVGYNFQRDLTSFRNFRIPARDLTDIQNAYGEFGYHFHPSWEVVGGFRYFELMHSEESRQFSNQQLLTYKGELRHRNAAGNYLGYELAVLDGEFTDRTTAQVNRFGKSYIQYRTGLTMDWKLTGKSKILGRLGYTIHESDTQSTRDFSGVTWLLDYRWKVTDKTRIEFATWRVIRPVDDPVASFVEDTGVSLSPFWELTSKFHVRSEFSYISRNYAGDPGTEVGLTERLEDYYTLEAGVGYSPISQLLFEVVYEYQNRQSTRVFSDYFYHTVNGVIRIDF